MTGRWLRWLLSLARGAERADHGPARLTILRQHRVYADDERPLYRLGVSESVLDRQLALLAEVGLAPVTVGEGLSWLAHGRPGHVVALTFDDGYRDNVTRALPALARHGARATFYLTAGLMETRQAPWWDVLAHLLTHTRAPRLAGLPWAGGTPLPLGDGSARRSALTALLPGLRVPPAARATRLAELATALEVAAPAPCELADWSEAAAFARAGMEVGAHTLTHPHLTTLDPAGQRAEITGSVALVRERLGVPCPGFAYPGGDHDAVTIAIAREAGLAHAVTTRPGDNRGDAPVWALRRRGFNEGTCLDPTGRFSRRLALAELAGAFDRLRGHDAGVAA